MGFNRREWWELWESVKIQVLLIYVVHVNDKCLTEFDSGFGLRCSQIHWSGYMRI